MTQEELEAWGRTIDSNMLLIKDVGNGTYAMLSRLIFHYTIKIGVIGDMSVYDDRWCYATEELGTRAFNAWDPAKSAEPDLWHRHPTSGRRREYAGNDLLVREYHAW